MNDEALANYAHDALKKTRDTAIYLIEQRYGAAPERSYFAGGSTGGREALAVVQQWPTDFNGAIVLYPAYNALALDLQFGRITRALAQPGAFPAWRNAPHCWKPRCRPVTGWTACATA